MVGSLKQARIAFVGAPIGRLVNLLVILAVLYAIFILAFQPNFAHPSAGPIVRAILGTVVLLGAGFLLSKYVLRHVFASIAKAPDTVVSRVECSRMTATNAATNPARVMTSWAP